ncbi:MAG: hypothetical protein OXB95_05730 [Rhodobacteraceae bacterium]|nr:hypothetical protein [Paracoccaceae bacterium]
MDVTLYTYGDVSNVPANVKIANGEEVLSLKLIERLHPLVKPCSVRPIQHFSDFFRIECQRLNKGMWMDSDILLFRKFNYNVEKMYFTKEGRSRIGFSAIYLPSSNPICSDYFNLRNSQSLIPPWLGIKRRLFKPALFRLTGRNYTASDLGITIFANDGFTRLAKKYGFFEMAAAKDTFYHWTGNDGLKAFEKTEFRYMVNDPAIVGLHIAKKPLATTPGVPGSLWRWALDKYGP